MKKTVIVILALLWIICLSLVIFMPFIKYKYAEHLYTEHNYLKAYDIYSKLGEYKDSNIQATSCLYHDGIQSCKRKNYKQAVCDFTKIEGYLDTNKYICSIYLKVAGDNYTNDCISQIKKHDEYVDYVYSNNISSGDSSDNLDYSITDELNKYSESVNEINDVFPEGFKKKTSITCIKKALNQNDLLVLKMRSFLDPDVDSEIRNELIEYLDDYYSEVLTIKYCAYGNPENTEDLLYKNGLTQNRLSEPEEGMSYGEVVKTEWGAPYKIVFHDSNGLSNDSGLSDYADFYYYNNRIVYFYYGQAKYIISE